MNCTETLTLAAGNVTKRVDLRVPCFATAETKHALVTRYLDQARQCVLGVANAVTLTYDLDGCKGRIR